LFCIFTYTTSLRNQQYSANVPNATYTPPIGGSSACGCHNALIDLTYTFTHNVNGDITVAAASLKIGDVIGG
jgi:hypothetical protein